MKFRKKNHKNESEVYTDSLNDILFILLMLFLIVSTVANPNIVKVANPKGSKNTKAKQDIVITIDKDQNYFLGQNKIPKESIDSVLSAEIRRFRRTPTDTPTVVINADTSAYYGDVYRIIRLATKDTARAVAMVK